MMSLYTTPEIEFGHYGRRSYRIEADLSNPHRPFQRHVWIKDDGSEFVEDWIESSPLRHMTPEKLAERGYTKMKNL